MDSKLKSRKEPLGKIINLPNTITLLRLLLVFPFAYFFLKSKTEISLAIFAIFAISDKLDGFLARAMDKKTAFGSIFDSASDTIFILAAIIIFVYSGHISENYALTLLLPIALTIFMKLYSLKKHKIIIKPIISTINVGLGYAAIFAFLIDYRYKGIFLASVIVSTYIVMAVFAFKILSKN